MAGVIVIRDPPRMEFNHRDRDGEFYWHGSGKRSGERSESEAGKGTVLGGDREALVVGEKEARIEQWNR
ncbi:hypothetical protein F2Q69_00028145 [Brassica cretica]|uniref:Uncharacterized protein n=1 Tax=Brassica cretica TaxID=69181 RepID=A0A8S9RTC1_BRACR|nr:hypothetical protein F2Q69_00028145 [Brassica cretica]